MSTPAIEEYLKQADSRSLDVLFWLLHNRDKENVIVTTMDEISKACGVTKVTVNRVFQRLYKAGFLIKIRNGQYRMEKI